MAAKLTPRPVSAWSASTSASTLASAPPLAQPGGRGGPTQPTLIIPTSDRIIAFMTIHSVMACCTSRLRSLRRCVCSGGLAAYSFSSERCLGFCCGFCWVLEWWGYCLGVFWDEVRATLCWFCGEGGGTGVAQSRVECTPLVGFLGVRSPLGGPGLNCAYLVSVGTVALKAPIWVAWGLRLVFSLRGETLGVTVTSIPPRPGRFFQSWPCGQVRLVVSCRPWPAAIREIPSGPGVALLDCRRSRVASGP